MSHDQPPQPRAPAPVSASPATERAHWTPAKQRIFLAALAESGSVRRAARAAGMSPSSAHRLRARLAGSPFDRAWAHVSTLHVRRLADPLADPTRGERAPVAQGTHR